MIPRLFFGALAAAGLGLTQLVVLETTDLLPEGWVEIETTPGSNLTIQISIALKHPEAEAIEKHFAGADDTHCTKEDTDALRTPRQGDVDNVMAWLNEHGIKGTQKKDWVQVSITVGKAEKLLNTKMSLYQFEDKAPVVRTKKYSVPKKVADSVTFVHPVSNFMRPKKELTSRDNNVALDGAEKNQNQKRAVPCASAVTPGCLRQLYNIPLENASSTASPYSVSKTTVRLAIAGFLEENANYADSDAFNAAYDPQLAAADYNFTIQNVNGGANSQVLSSSGGEAMLDVEYAMAVGYPANITYYLTGGRGTYLDDDTGNQRPESSSTNEPYLEFVEYMLSLSDDELPHVISVSYADNEVTVPKPYAQRVCNLLGLLTARGTSILVASGDGGARGSSDSPCHTIDGSNKDVTMSVFPASCPWVTSVGGVDNGNVVPPVGSGLSGGGFSQYFARPSWQAAAVSGYVSELDGFLGAYYNPKMRAVPDISAVASGFTVRYAGAVTGLRGTSASTPVVAAMIARINQERLNQGKKSLGWLNQKLYSSAVSSVLQDITDGQSYSCTFSDGKMPGGWPAKKGWDAITGLGVPNDFEKFAAALVKL